MTGFADLAARYDGFIVDLWGVVHDGVRPLPGVLDCLRRLQAAAKPVVFLSNAPRRAAAIAQALAAMGIAPTLYAGIMSSGEAVHQALRDRADPAIADPAIAALGQRLFHLGPAPRPRRFRNPAADRGRRAGGCRLPAQHRAGRPSRSPTTRTSTRRP